MERELGGLEQAKEAYRERRGLPVLETFVLDLRCGGRMLRKSPALTTMAILSGAGPRSEHRHPHAHRCPDAQDAAEFFGVETGRTPSITIPMATKRRIRPDSWLTKADYNWLSVMAHLKSGVSRERLSAGTPGGTSGLDGSVEV